jgi:hypothetical protein
MDGQELAERIARHLRRLPQDRESLMKALVAALSAQELVGEQIERVLGMLVHTLVRRTQYVPSRDSSGYCARTATGAVLCAMIAWERDLIDSGQENLLLGTELRVSLHKSDDGWVARVTEES